MHFLSLLKRILGLLFFIVNKINRYFTIYINDIYKESNHGV